MKWLSHLPGWGGPLSDEDAMRRVRTRGDHAAFTQLVARWEPPIRRLCVRMTGDEHRGEDLAQEAFARVFANRHRYADGKRFSTWLWRIALNLCHEASRRAVVRNEHTFGDGDEPSAVRPAPDEDAVMSERATLVREALARLPEAQRAVVILREYENLKFREIAEVLNVPEGTVKWRMAEALDQLGRELKPVLRGDDDLAPRAAEPATAQETETTSPIDFTAKASVAL